MSLTWVFEEALLAEGFELICGVDEAGRGPLAGPVYAAAVILPTGVVIEGLNDSKKLSGHKRERVYDEIINRAVAYACACADHREIDELNILGATFLAMNRALEELNQRLSAAHHKPVNIDIALIDGNQNSGIRFPSRCLIKGDSKSPSVAAASIIAKVTRDRYMLNMAQQYPQYCFERHKGYGTKLHFERLREYGPSPIHRQTFIKKKVKAWQAVKAE